MDCGQLIKQELKVEFEEIDQNIPESPNSKQQHSDGYFLVNEDNVRDEPFIKQECKDEIDVEEHELPGWTTDWQSEMTVHKQTDDLSNGQVCIEQLRVCPVKLEDVNYQCDVSEMSEDITRRNAQNCKKYYSRKKSANLRVVKKKTNSEKCRQYRQRKKLLAQQLQSKSEVIHTVSISSLQMTFEPQQY
ncbi:unnamed protein product, partial [Leptidea sinapis]